jgi:hypothetical protein
MALVPQLQLGIFIGWCLQSMGSLYSFVPQVLTLLSHGDAAPVVKTHYHLDDVGQDNILSRVKWLVIGFIAHLQLGITSNYNAAPDKSL